MSEDTYIDPWLIRYKELRQENKELKHDKRASESIIEIKNQEIKQR